MSIFKQLPNMRRECLQFIGLSLGTRILESGMGAGVSVVVKPWFYSFDTPQQFMRLQSKFQNTFSLQVRKE